MKFHTLSTILLSTIATLTAGDQKITLEWNRSPEPDIAFYIIYYGNISRQYYGATNVGNVVRGTVSGLEAGTNWVFAVTAINIDGLESDFSVEVFNRIPSKPSIVVITTNFWVVPPMRTITVTEPIIIREVAPVIQKLPAINFVPNSNTIQTKE